MVSHAFEGTESIQEATVAPLSPLQRDLSSEVDKNSLLKKMTFSQLVFKTVTTRKTAQWWWL